VWYYTPAVVHTCKPSSPEADAEVSLVQGHPEADIETLLPKKFFNFELKSYL
jgi:hypothetical protein